MAPFFPHGDNAGLAKDAADVTTEPEQAPAAADPTLPERLRIAAELLEAVAADASLLDALSPEERARWQRALAFAYHPDPKGRRKRMKKEERARTLAAKTHDDALLDATGIRSLRRKPVFSTPNYFPPEMPADNIDDDEHAADHGPVDLMLPRPGTRLERHCYVCKRKYSTLHHFYDQLCPECGEFNFRKRAETADLRGRVALLTGGRVKIGFQAGLKLLRAGCELIVTTRFPRDSAQRYASEPDFAEWGTRLQIYGLDLRHTPSVETFCEEILATRSRLDFIVSNACQTVRRPPAFYQHMMALETDMARAAHGDAHALVHVLDEHLEHAPGLARAPELSQLALLPEDVLVSAQLFPEGKLDADLQQVDLREKNSWRLQLDEVSAVELLEVQLVNAVAPFVLNARLRQLMRATPGRDKHIVNVSAMEGQFYRNFKTTRHPHTNMAKAALNMMTRTSAADYESDGIHMNSVDTGWITDEDPAHIATRKQAEERFHPPLDIIDGAARIVDPIIDGVNSGVHAWGQFIKDYKPTDW
ncbi:MAG: SDR family oxidoreductase [Arenimonas sp.]